MAINIKFDLTGNPEPPTIILANRNGNKLGQLKVNEDSIDLSDKFNDASEISFTVNKYIDGKLTPLWDKLVDFKLIWCKEWDLWFEIKVELDEETESVKTVFCTQLGQAELSQIMLYNIEINTEKDIERDDYKISILWDASDPKASILNRLLEKAPHYSIIHVDSTIAKLQRSFSFDGTSIHDAFQEIAEEIGCLFVYHSNSGENGKIQRTISVYDLQQNCLNPDCKHRGEFIDVCPKCDGKNKSGEVVYGIKQGYGEDTLIFVTSDELASEGIQLTTDTDSVKNCFKLEVGDDLMTATVRNCNPNGTDYIWRFSDIVKEDMSKDLVDKLNSYDSLYKDYYNNHESKLDINLVNQYNALVEKYKGFYNTKSTCLNCKYEAVFEGNCPQCGSSNILSGKNLQSIPTTIKGYSSLMNAYYNTIDLALYLQSGLMPTVEMSNTNAHEQANLLTSSSLSPVAVNTKNAAAISLATADSAVLSMAKIIVKSTYKVEVKTSTLSNDKIWEGNFVITNYSDDNDTAESQIVKVAVNNDAETFIKQKIEKALNKEDTDDYSVSGLFERDYDNFCSELKKYALNPLKSFYDTCDACINILIDQGAGNQDENPDLYESLYVPYYNKSSAIGEEIKIRENEIAVIEGVWDKTDEDNPKLETEGLQYYIEKCRNEIQDALNFEKYLGENLWLEFCSYRREDTYSNSNYVSDGLNNTELFEKALEFIEVAENEIYKSSELQCSISTSLNNLLAIDKFKPLVDSFELGNWIRVQVDDEIYKLRLIEYDIDFGSFDNISVEFSDVTKIKNGITDIESVLSQASSMASSYDSIQRQAKQGDNAKTTVDQWLENGLNSALVRIKSNNNEEVTMTKNGLLCRSYDDITESYLPEQFRLTHNIMAYTSDDWNTVSTALGKHSYVYYNANKILQDGIDYGLSSKFVTAGYINGSQIIGGEIYSQNYTSTTGTHLDLNNGNFSWAGGKIKYDSKSDNVTLKGVSLTWEDIGDAPTKVSAFENDVDYKNGTQVTTITQDTIKTTNVVAQNLQVKAANIDGKLTASQINADGIKAVNVDISGKITASSGSITGDLSVSGSLTHTRGNYTVTLRAVPTTVTNGVFYITDKSSGSNVYPFIVSGDGSFRATKADITGKITTTSGTIANWDIGSSTIQKKVTVDGKNIVTGMQQPNSGTWAFFAGTYNGSNYGDCEFRVSHKGKLYASGAVISGNSTFGGTLSAADGTFKGKLSAVSGTFTELKADKSIFNKSKVEIKTDDNNYVRITSGGIKINTSAKGYVVIGQDPDESSYDEITIFPWSDCKGNIGTPEKRWDVMHAEAFSNNSSRDIKEDIQIYNKEQAYYELKNLPIYTYRYKNSSSQTLTIGSVIDYLPTEVMLAAENENISYNIGNMLFWNIAASQVIQEKLESLILKVEELESKIS